MSGLLFDKLDVAGAIEPTAAFGHLLQAVLIADTFLGADDLVQGLMKPFPGLITIALQGGQSGHNLGR